MIIEAACWFSGWSTSSSFYTLYLNWRISCPAPLYFSCNCCLFVPAQAVTAVNRIHTLCAFGSSAGINKGSCFRINHFPEDNDYDTDSSEYILRKSLQPLHVQTHKPLILCLFSSSGDGVITRVLNVSWHLYPSTIKAWCHDSNRSHWDDGVCCVLMSNWSKTWLYPRKISHLTKVWWQSILKIVCWRLLQFNPCIHFACGLRSASLCISHLASSLMSCAPKQLFPSLLFQYAPLGLCHGKAGMSANHSC